MDRAGRAGRSLGQRDPALT
ncbi:hypothetical protein CCACVL1_04475 [Corchorus capsularis]|uniref:Uncharacterized protein n=1 Tax=Corchorus capsularis TaxID=210143 RepID=A0A1R3G3T9_COCAP|nr:hypothetical protein CCACVL1_29117 [Corchorus capsularis]OMO97739.1 hypothetical protein CCACVL1_04475 [Corchorus capsularis]